MTWSYKLGVIVDRYYEENFSIVVEAYQHVEELSKGPWKSEYFWNGVARLDSLTSVPSSALFLLRNDY